MSVLFPVVKERCDSVSLPSSLPALVRAAGIPNIRHVSESGKRSCRKTFEPITPLMFSHHEVGVVAVQNGIFAPQFP